MTKLTDTQTARLTWAAVSQSGAAAKPEPAQAVLASAYSAAIAVSSPRSGSKKALVIAMLERGEGASIADLVERTGWRPHTTRAVLTGLRKTGMPVTAVREAGCATRYRITRCAAGRLASQAEELRAGALRSGGAVHQHEMGLVPEAPQS